MADGDDRATRYVGNTHAINKLQRMSRLHNSSGGGYQGSLSTLVFDVTWHGKPLIFNRWWETGRIIKRLSGAAWGLKDPIARRGSS